MGYFLLGAPTFEGSVLALYDLAHMLSHFRYHSFAYGGYIAYTFSQFLSTNQNLS